MDDLLQPLLTLRSKDPDVVLGFLSELSDARPGATVDEGQEVWVSVASGLMEFLYLPVPEKANWSAYKQKIDLLEKAIHVIKSICARVDGVFTRAGNIVHILLMRLLDLYCVLDIWTRHEDSPVHSICPPNTLRDAVRGFMLEVCCNLGNSPPSTDGKSMMWEVLRKFLVEILDMVNDLTTRGNLVLPVTLHMFKQYSALDKKLPDGSARDKDPLEIKLGQYTSLNTFLVLGLDTVTQVLALPLKSAIFLTDLIRSDAESTRLVFDFFSSTTCLAAVRTRHELLTQVVSNAGPLYGRNSVFSHALEVLPIRLLHFRIQHNQKIDPRDVINSGKSFIRPTQFDILSSLKLMEGPISGNSMIFLISFLSENISSANLDTLVQIKAITRNIDFGIQTTFAEDLDRRICDLQSQNTETSSASNDAKWRQQVKTLVQAMLVEDDIIWAEEFTSHQFALFVLERLGLYFDKSLALGTSDARVLLAKQLGNLMCLLAFCDGLKCAVTSTKIKLKTIPASSSALRALLRGNEDEVTSEVRRQMYISLTCVIRHHCPSELDSNGFRWFLEATMEGILDKDRSTRLHAGKAFGALMCLMSKNDMDIGPPFERLYVHFDDGKLWVKETLIISIGSMGYCSIPEVVSQALCFLIAQLGNQYPPVKGSAYVHIEAITQHHNKSLYSLLGHHMDRVALFLVSTYCTQPTLTTEACRLMSMTVATFISMTRRKTYPQLFAKNEGKVLRRIAKELGVPVFALYASEYASDSAQILAHVFQLQNPAQTRKALESIEEMAKESVEKDRPDIPKLVKMCLVPLLGELVADMGYEQKKNMAITALQRVEQTVTRRSGSVQSPLAVENFLRQHALGIVSYLGDMLQDAHTEVSLAHKRAILRSMGILATLIGRSVSNVAPQYMSTYQTMLAIPELTDVTLDSWYTFLTTLGSDELGPYVGPTTAAFISAWHSFSAVGRGLVVKSLMFIIQDCGTELGSYLDDVADLSIIPDLTQFARHLKRLQNAGTAKEQLQRILDRSSSENLTVALLALRELKAFLSAEKSDFVRTLVSGDIFDPLVGHIMGVLLHAACLDGEGCEPLRSLAYEVIGVLGAVDPDRFEINYNDPTWIVLNNFTDDTEAIEFTIHIIRDLLVGVFRATSDVSCQRNLSYTLQQLLRVCGFTPALVAGGGGSVPVKVRNRWNSFPRHIVETLSPLLDAKYGIVSSPTMDPNHPIYTRQSTYREWIQLWTCHLITRASGGMAKNIFGPFFPIVKNRDVVVAYHILPHLILNILISGSEKDVDGIRIELLTILQDQVQNDSSSSPDKKLLSAQAVFMILDHLNKWVRLIRRDVGTKKAESKRARSYQISNDAEEQLLRVDSVLSSIDANLMARAALKCKAYARALMNFESQILSVRAAAPQHKDLPSYYEQLHEIYYNLDEPDGMEGVSTLILSPSLEHQIRQHESTGRWTSAQSCWEVRLQQSPNNLDFHLGLLRCLRNLGHYDTLRTHVKGVLVRNAEWEGPLAGFQIESAWMVGAWDDVHALVQRTNVQNASIVMARVLLAMQNGDPDMVSESLSAARCALGAPITAAGIRGYRRSYEATLNLHLMYELELIYRNLTKVPSNSQQRLRKAISSLSPTLSTRFDSTLPNFRIREPVLSMRRTAFILANISQSMLVAELGRSWLASARIARKAGHWQTAYSALLQAKQTNANFSFIESAKLVKATGEPLRAIRELENAMRMQGMIEDGNVLDLTADDEESKQLKAKAQVLRARWMHESDRYEDNDIFRTFTGATQLCPNWESCQFHLGRFHDECFKNLSPTEQVARGRKMMMYTVRSFSKAIKAGSKYVFQTVPRLLTIWLDMGDDKSVAGTDIFKKINETVAKAISEAPAYKWYTAFPQIVSRIGHTNPDVFNLLSKLIIRVMEEYPKQALWLFTSVAKSTKLNREQRGKAILDRLRSDPKNAKTEIPSLVMQCSAMTDELLNLCDYNIGDEKKALTMKDFPKLAALGKSRLIIPLQESLTASLPPTSSSESTHQPFPSNAPTFERFFDEIEVMHSLAKPRKISIQGSDGQVYMFLGKPRDDLRKDARLMDFNSIINKLLKANSESRRRQLRIRTYGVVTLNEECGFIQWVPNTIPIRPVLVKAYEAKKLRNWSNDMNEIFKKIKEAKDKDAVELFTEKILKSFPPLFHEWFAATFPEPTAWLSSRLAYGRTAAVMSMVGFILGLGDRHCENILLDVNTGDAIHVDFNCLFEKGKTLETPERVPFRLTQNLVDGLGVTGVEGVFRIACEITLQLLRDHKDSLMSVLDAFIHDPLVEWEDERRKLERVSGRRNNVKATVDLHNLAKTALLPIERKLKGIYSTGGGRPEKEISTSNLVQMLIQEATDLANLAKMYPGWAPWH